MSTAVIAGASGLVGGFLLAKLLEDSRYERVIVLGRRAFEHTSLPKLVSIVVDFATLGSNVELAERLGVGDDADLFCALGTTIKKAGSREEFRAVDHEAVLAFARWGRRAGARRFFLVSAMGADRHSAIFYNHVKGETENSLRHVGFTELWIFRPSLLLGPRREFRLGERVAEVVFRQLRFVFRGPLAAYAPIHAETVATAMMRAAHSTPTAPGTFVLSSADCKALR